MAEAGVDISHQKSKRISNLSGISFDYVITLCDNAFENCPVFPGNARHIHKPFPDPTFTVGTKQEILVAFRKLRDDIKTFVEKMPEILETEYSKQK